MNVENFYEMNTGCVIFDMDGLLIDSEPLWEQAGNAVLAGYGVTLTGEEYTSSVGLRTKEWIELWFEQYQIKAPVQEGIEAVETLATQYIVEKGSLMPGVAHTLSLLEEAGYTIGLASSSPMRLITAAVEQFKISQYFKVKSSAEHLEFGKPHPQVYINCAKELGFQPHHCLAFEDSFNGMIAAKAARMKCIVVPAALFHSQVRWQAADAQLKSLEEVTADLIKSMF